MPIAQVMLVFFMIMLFCCGSPQGIPQAGETRTAPAGAGARSGHYVPGELLVKFRAGVSEDRIQWILNQIRGQTIDVIATIRLYRVRIADHHRVAEAITVLEGFAEVEYAEFNAVDSVHLPE
jgi:hypothetical protein